MPVVDSKETAPAFAQPDYDYGNHSPIQVIRLKPVMKPGLDPHAALEHSVSEQSPYSREQIIQAITEGVANYQVFTDPKSPENEPRHFGGTVVNRHLVAEGAPAILMITTVGSSLYDEKLNPNNESNLLELAYTALKYPDRPVVLVEAPGNGNSTDLTRDEYRQAAENGRLVHATKDHSGKTDYEAFETLQAMARSLENEGVKIGWVSANASGAHYASAVEAALPAGTMESAFLYNPTNISDRSLLGLTYGTLKEIATQGKYAEKSRDPLRITEEMKETVRKIMSSAAKRKIDQARASTHNPAKLYRQQQILRRGNRHGQAAAVHVAAAQKRHPDMRQTLVFPEFAAQYKRPEDFQEFMRIVNELGGLAVNEADLESLQIPLGQYGHAHYPTVRQTLESFAFKR